MAIWHYSIELYGKNNTNDNKINKMDSINKFVEICNHYLFKFSWSEYMLIMKGTLIGFQFHKIVFVCNINFSLWNCFEFLKSYAAMLCKISY